MEAEGRQVHPGHEGSMALTCVVRVRGSGGGTPDDTQTPCTKEMPCMAETSSKVCGSCRQDKRHWGWAGGGPQPLSSSLSYQKSPYLSTAPLQHNRTFKKHNQSHTHFTWTDRTFRSRSHHKKPDRTQTLGQRTALGWVSAPSPVGWTGAARWVLVALLLTLHLLTPGVQGQADTCSALTDCHPTSENLLNNNYPQRVLDVSSTCGTPDGTTTPYRKSAATLDFTDFYCNATYPRPKELMHDHQNEKVLDFEYENPKLSTYWQSENAISGLGALAAEEWVVVNMTEAFLVRYIRAVFISPHIDSPTDDSDMRPLAMAIERQATPGTEWEPWRFYALDCLAYFGQVPWQPLDGSGPTYDALTPVCQTRYYAGSTPVTGWGFGRQEVLFNPSKDYDREFQTSAAVQRHFMASAVRLRLVHPADSEPLSSYYAIADLEVDGQCACFGHASFCSGLNGATCVCHHNTEGRNCEKCQPLFNNKPWRAGALQQANACEDCGCGRHAMSCHYDETRGHGVCDNCTDNTMGDKCEFCMDHFYINPANTSLLAPTDICTGMLPGYNGTEYITHLCNDSCIPCNCSLAGSDPSGSYTCQNSTGQCACRAHVESRDCSLCKDEYYNLTSANPDGCVPCDCERSGTVNNTQLCDKETGACICKNHTTGHRCDQCQAGYYGLSAANPDGCRSCDCDPGASLNTTCPLVTGLCPCRDYIHGRTCREPAIGFYVPALDHLTYDAEFVPNVTAQFPVVERPGHGLLSSTVTGRGFVRLPESSTLKLTIRVPRTLNYHVILRYETAGLWAPAHLSLSVPVAGNVTHYVCGGTTHNVNTLLQLEGALHPASTAGGADMGLLCLLAHTDYDLHVELGNSDPRGEQLLLDSVVLLPLLTDMAFFGEVSPEERAALQACYQSTVTVSLEARANMSCSEHDYSVMAYLYQGATECLCDEVGSNSSLCDPVGGQCPCKPGVMLLDCSQCQVDHYGFSTGQGCTPCGCDPHGSVRTACNDTGVCECQPNVQGDRCDACIPNHYGLYTGSGCVECTCNSVYAYNNSCEDTGQCHCKPGVGGQNCDSCRDGFYDLTEEGCTPCGCDSGGSTTTTCDKVTGVCTCKTLAVGDKCDTCQAGYFALGDWSPLGCLQCYCSGHSSDCLSASGWYLTNASNDWSLLMSATAIEEPWEGEDGAGRSVPVHHPVKIIGNEGQFVMQITNIGDNEARDDIFLLAPAGYLGNKRSAYQHFLTFSLSMYIPDPPGNETLEDPLILQSADGDVILEGPTLDFRLVAALPAPPGSNVTDYSFQMSSDAWHVDTVGGPSPTYVQMIQVLSHVSALKIRAKYSNVTGAEVALYSALLTYAVNDSSSGLPVNNVENCTCPKQYTGPQCERCAAGYTRLTPGGGAYTECVPCNCHGHGAPDTPCHPETGQCTCTHHTSGDLCNTCQEGYYGDPTRGAPDACMPCMCPGNVIEADVNVFAHTCSLGPAGTPVCHNCTEGHGGDQCDVCVDQWYGVPADPQNAEGRCVPCSCNGRADTCNSTSGECTDCRNNTAGQTCHICAPTFFGNAMTGDCQPCECTSVGAEGDCDHRTGQCVCKKNVVGFKCTECGPYSYNYTSGEGCYDCDCHSIGALDQQCDVTTGQCVCHVHLEGRRCDRCEDTYWNINALTGCDRCGCTDIGTANITGQTFGTCDLFTGQCACARDGIIGRTCDYCAKGTKEEFEYVTGIYVGTYPMCELCGECFDNWGKKIDEVGTEMVLQYTDALHIWNHYSNLTVDEVNPIIGNLSANISLVDASINSTYRTVQALRGLQDGYMEVSSNVSVHQEELERLSALLEDAEGTLIALHAFDGTVPLPPDAPTTPALTASRVDEVTALHATLYTQANASWAGIQNLTEAVRVSNGSVAVFVDRVRAAIFVLDDARRMSEAAEMTLGNYFRFENANNTARLGALQAAILDYEVAVRGADTEVGAARLMLFEANMTVDMARDAVSVRRGQMAVYLDTAQVTVFNATLSKMATETAAATVNILLTEANVTRRNLTAALVDVVTGLHLTENVTTQVGVLDAAMAELTATSLRPLTALTAVTTQIQAASVSPGDVQQILARGDAALNMAQTAINVTETASDEAHRTLEEVRTIQHNIQEAEILRTDTQDLVNTVQGYNNTIVATLNAVQSKASLAAQLAADIHSNISVSADDINTIYRCFQDKQQRANDSRHAALNAREQAKAAAKVHVDNVDDLSSVLETTQRLEGKYTSFLQGMLGVKVQVDGLLSDLGIVSGSNDVSFVLETFRIQKTEIEKLLSELQNISVDANTAESVLDRLDPETASCTHS